MKKIMLLAAVSFAAFGPGCKKAKRLADIAVDIPYSTTATIPHVDGAIGVPIPGGTVIAFPTIAVETNSKQYIAQYHTSSSKVVSVDLKSLAIQVLSPSTQNFDFLDTVQLYVSAMGQPEVLVAYRYDIPKGQNTLDFNTATEINLKNYFLADTMYFRMRAHINAVPETGAKLNIDTKFHMIANPLE